MCHSKVRPPPPPVSPETKPRPPSNIKNKTRTSPVYNQPPSWVRMTRPLIIGWYNSGRLSWVVINFRGKADSVICVPYQPLTDVIIGIRHNTCTHHIFVAQTKVYKVSVEWFHHVTAILTHFLVSHMKQTSNFSKALARHNSSPTNRVEATALLHCALHTLAKHSRVQL